MAYYQHFLFENIAFWEVPRSNHKCGSPGATHLVNVKLECEARRISRQTFWVFRVFFVLKILFVYFRLATVRRHVAVATPTAQVATLTAQLKISKITYTFRSESELPVTYAVTLTFDSLTFNHVLAVKC